MDTKPRKPSNVESDEAQAQSSRQHDFTIPVRQLNASFVRGVQAYRSGDIPFLSVAGLAKWRAKRKQTYRRKSFAASQDLPNGAILNDLSQRDHVCIVFQRK